MPSVRVWVSAGAHIALPSLLGETQRSAEIRVAQDGLMIGTVSEIRSALYPPDVVVAQDPPPSTQTAEIRLLVNRGEDRATYVMPDRSIERRSRRDHARAAPRLDPLCRRPRRSAWRSCARPPAGFRVIPAMPSRSR
jgi:hypothetical protein